MPSLTPILAGPYSDSPFEITPSADVAAQHRSKDQGKRVQDEDSFPAFLAHFLRCIKGTTNREI